MKIRHLALTGTILLCTAAPAHAQYKAPPVHVTQPRVVMPPGVSAQPHIYMQQPNAQHHGRHHRYYCPGAISGPSNATGPVYGQRCYNAGVRYPYTSSAFYGGTTVYTVLWGTISEVDDNIVTIQLDGQPAYGSLESNIVRIDVQEAVSHDQAGRLDIGRHVMAYGYWQDGLFFAIRLA